MQKLASGVYVESAFAGVTVGAVVTKEGVICIDTPSHPVDAQKWRQKLRQLSSKPILYVINTDHHRDRIVGNQWFNAPVIAHEFTGERLRLYPEILKSAGIEAGPDYEIAKELAGVRIVPPQITFATEMVLLKKDREIVLQHRPGSAPGALWVLLPGSGIVFTGDSVVDSHPFLAEANIDQWLEQLVDLRRAKFPAKTIVPGRGKAIGKDKLTRLQNYLKFVKRRLPSGRSKRVKFDFQGVSAELMRKFPSPENQREAVARRVRAGLERMVASLYGESV